MNQLTRCDRLIQIRAPEFLTKALNNAANKRLISLSDYIRVALLDRLRADGMSPTSWRSDCRRMPSSVPRLKRRKGEPKPGRRALPPESMSAEHTRLIPRWRDTAFGSPMRLVPGRSISFIQC
jgi:hypothetical protein